MPVVQVLQEFTVADGIVPAGTFTAPQFVWQGTDRRHCWSFDGAAIETLLFQTITPVQPGHGRTYVFVIPFFMVSAISGDCGWAVTPELRFPGDNMATSQFGSTSSTFVTVSAAAGSLHEANLPLSLSSAPGVEHCYLRLQVARLGSSDTASGDAAMLPPRLELW